MVHEAQVLNRESLRVWLRVDGKLGEGEDARLLPAVDFLLDCGGPQKIWAFRSGVAFFWGRHVHVWTADIVFSAVLALREVFITADVSTLAGITTFARLGMAVCVLVSLYKNRNVHHIPPSGRAATGSSHCE